MKHCLDTTHYPTCALLVHVTAALTMDSYSLLMWLFLLSIVGIHVSRCLYKNVMGLCSMKHWNSGSLDEDMGLGGLTKLCTSNLVE